MNSSETPEEEFQESTTDSVEMVDDRGDSAEHSGAIERNADLDDDSVDDDSDQEEDEENLSDADIAAGFATLGLRPELLSALVSLGYEEPTPIQRETIPLLLEGRDLVGQAATGTGKTAAFALPILNRITKGSRRPELMALILVPTRELAVQVSEALYKYGRDLGAKVVPIYGGQPIGRQLQALSGGVHIVVATPGRAMDHISRGTLDLATVEIVVLDEADEMLDMGFAEDIEEILSSTPDDRQTVMFSATLPPRINGIAKRHLTDPLKIQIGLGDNKVGKQLVRQTAYIVQRSHKAAALGRVLDIESPGATIVFCRTRTEVDLLTETMNGRGYRAEALHGGLSQESRDKVMNRLRTGTTELLIATDVAARGLDIDQLTHVVNYDVPSAPESYVHRIGRVGRAGREGTAITLAEPREQRLLANIERLTKQKIIIAKVPTVADLRARQIELTVSTLRDTLASEDLEDYATVIDTLSDYDVRDLALAAIKWAHLTSGAVVDEKEIPDASIRLERDSNARGKFGRDRDGGRGDKPSWGRDRPTYGSRDGGRDGGGRDAGRDGGRPSYGRDRDGDAGRDARPRGEFVPRSDSGVAKVFFSVGREDGVRAGDFVGAIANETNLSGKQIGPIKIADRYTVVGVPEEAVEDVIRTMKKATLKGHKPSVRRFVEDPR